jgi:hypothetical protein
MNLRFLSTALLAACVGATAFGQALDRAIVASTAPLTEAQKTALSGFLAKHVAAVKSGTDATANDESRMAVVAMLRDPAATTQFRRAVATALVAELGPVVKGADSRRAIVAMQLLRFTRAQEALDLVIERTSPGSERDAGKRIAAASLVIDAFEDLDASNTYVETVARRLRDASASETDPIALQQKLVAIAASARRKDLTPENVRSIRKFLVETISGVAKSMKSATGPDQRVMALQRVLLGVRNDLLEMPQTERGAIFRALAPALVEIISAASSQWTKAHDDKALSASYASVMNSCEVLLRLIDRSERASVYSGSKPDADQRLLTPAWEGKDKAKFDAELKKWSDIVGAAPYRG